MIEHVQIFGTGGTIDKAYHPVEEKLRFHRESVIPRILKSAKIPNCQFDSIMKMDSLDMGDTERATIVEAIENCDSDCIVIVHGTGTIGRTAKHLSETVGNSKRIILTGSLVPYRYDPVEAAANLSMAISSCRLLSKEGVYIAMHGLVRAHDKLKKNRKTGVFNIVD